MVIILVLNEKENNDKVEEQISAQYEHAEIVKYIDPMLAVKYCSQHVVDLICTQMELKYMDGMSLLNMTKKLLPHSTGYLIKTDELQPVYGA